MKAKHILSLLILSMAAAFAYCCYSLNQMFRPWGDRGRAYETWEAANNTFKVRITAHHEANVYLPGAFYVCESSPSGSDEWREFMVFRVDDPHPIPHKLFRFVNDEIAYIYMSDDYVVTVNGGRSWSVWKPILPLPSGESVYWAIKEVDIEPNGVGKAKLSRYDEQVKDRVFMEVETRDYGRHWSAL